MNKQELIERLEGLKNIFGNECEYVKIDFVIELASELDEPQPVKVPQIVADWIEVCKEHLTHSLYTAMTPNFMKENGQSLDLILWIKKASNQDIFARAWLDGYEVEKEKRYTVVMKETKQPLYYNASENKLFFSMGGLATQFTRQQLEKLNFGWVFDCEGIEVEEVEE
nr:MAG TPA: Protein of unknown function (DUF1642) [Caudoviricetes sp.]